MIKTATITNFQSHRSTKLDFAAPGVNVIIGASDVGKSAIFRALIWALFNRPLGEGVRSHWSDKSPTSVELELLDGHKLIRSKGKSVNEYQLDDLVMRAIGKDPPEEILHAHRISRGLNIQSQIDQFFLLQSSPGEVATYLNQVAGLSDIDYVTKRLQSHERSIRRQIENQEQHITKLESSLEQYADLDRIGEKINQATDLSNGINQTKHRVGRLYGIVERIQHIEDKMEIVKEKLTIKPKVNSAIRIRTELDNTKRDQKRLTRIVNEIINLSEDQKVSRQKLNETKPLLTKALQLEGQISELQNGITVRKREARSIRTKQKNVEDRKLELTRLKDRWHELMPEGSQCPLCGAILPGNFGRSNLS